MNQLLKFQLSNSFKRIGLGIAFVSFLGMLINKFSLDSEAIRTTGKYGLLIGFLIMSISKEKIEDELITRLRMQSYSFAFIVGVCYALLLPVVDYLFDFMLDNQPTLKPLSNFVVLWLLLSIQVLSFELLKKRA